MNIVEMIARSHNGHGLDVLGQQFGLTREQTLEAVAELAPVVTSGVRRNTRQDDGVVSLLEALSGGRHERYLEDDSAVQYDQVRDEGNAILGHLFGDKQVSREVAMHAAGSTGIGSCHPEKDAAGNCLHGAWCHFQADDRWQPPARTSATRWFRRWAGRHPG
jgi:hypothetical protein